MKTILHSLISNLIEGDVKAAEVNLTQAVEAKTKDILQLNEFDFDKEDYEDYEEDRDAKKARKDAKQREFEKKNKDKIAAAKKEAGVEDEEKTTKAKK